MAIDSTIMKRIEDFWNRAGHDNPGENENAIRYLLEYLARKQINTRDLIISERAAETPQASYAESLLHIKIDRLQQKLHDAERDKLCAEGELAVLRLVQENCADENRELKNQIARLKNAKDRKYVREQRLEAEIARLQERLNQLDSPLQRARDERLRERERRLEAKTYELQDQIQIADQRILGLERDLKQARDMAAFYRDQQHNIPQPGRQPRAAAPRWLCKGCNEPLTAERRISKHFCSTECKYGETRAA